jgi:hypothetical protein
MFPDVSKAHEALFYEPRFWFALTLAVCGSLVADAVVESFRRAVRPCDFEILQEAEKDAAAAAAAAAERRKKSTTSAAAVASSSTSTSTSTDPSSFSFSLLGSSGDPRSTRHVGVGRHGAAAGTLPTTTHPSPASSGESFGDRRARRKSRNPSVMQVVSDHRAHSPDWHP